MITPVYDTLKEKEDENGVSETQKIILNIH